MTKRISAFNYFGGKNLHLDFLLPLFPANAEHIVDCFGGSGAIALNVADNGIAPKPHVTYNDLDGRLHNFFKTLRDQPEELVRAVALSPHSRRDYDEARGGKNYAGANAVEQARQTYVLIMQSINGLMDNRVNNWSYSKHHYHVKTPERKAEELLEVARRLSRISLENKTYADLLTRYAAPTTLFYLDPPYVNASRSRPRERDYKHDFTDEDQALMLQRIRAAPAMACLSGYKNDLYDEVLHDWIRVDNKPKGSGSARGKKRVESCWLNYDPPTNKLL